MHVYYIGLFRIKAAYIASQLVAFIRQRSVLRKSAKLNLASVVVWRLSIAQTQRYGSQVSRLRLHGQTERQTDRLLYILTRGAPQVNYST